ncbi:MAG TPA: SRPBCC family protein [Gammaproteobacteria bacterium]
MNNEHGVVTEPGTIVFRRTLPGPIERVWAYLTESGKRGKWFAAGDTELAPGGKVEFHFLHRNLSPEPTPERFKDMENGISFEGRVTACDPPRMLSYTWPEAGGGDNSEVTFELTPLDDNVLLVLTHRRLTPDNMAGTAAGWHAHLGVLDDVLNRRSPRGFWTAHAKAEADYERIITK